MRKCFTGEAQSCAQPYVTDSLTKQRNKFLKLTIIHRPKKTATCETPHCINDLQGSIEAKVDL